MVRELATVTRVGLRSVLRAPLTAAIVVLSVAAAALSVIALLALADGFRTSMQPIGGTARAILLSETANSEERSTLNSLEVDRIRAALVGKAAQVQAENSLGVDIVDPQGRSEKVVLRGIDHSDLLPLGIRMVAGRWTSSATRELAVGQTLARRNPALRPGALIQTGPLRWTVAGIFVSEVVTQNGEMLTSSSMLNTSFRNPQSFQLVRMGMATGESEKTISSAVLNQTGKRYEVFGEQIYYERASSGISGFFKLLVYPLALITGLAVSVAILNLCLTIISKRKKELATLYTIGFTRDTIMVAEVVQAVSIALSGGAIAVCAALLLDDCEIVTSLGRADAAASVIKLDVTAASLAAGLVYAALLGLVSGFFPARRAVTAAAVTSLREAS